MDDLQEEYRSLRKRLKHLNLSLTNATTAVTERCQRDLQKVEYQKKLNQLNIEKLQDNFPQLYHEENEKLLDSVHDVLFQIGQSLPQKNPIFNGHFVRIGSFRDGTKTSSVNEFDFLYVLDSINPEDIRLEKTRSSMICKVYQKDIVIGTDQLFTDFSRALIDIGANLKLPEGLDHGGFGWPKFSGIRFNEPAVTFLFVWNGDPERKNHLISVDLTTALQLPMTEERPIIQDIREKIRPILRQNNMIWFDLEGKIHLVPIFPEENEWYITTAQLEAELLHPLSADTPVKTSIKTIKTLSHDLISGVWDEEIWPEFSWEAVGDSPAVREVLAVLELYQNCKVAEQGVLLPILSEIMAFAHVLLPSKIGDRFMELAKTQVSLNTAAIKNLALLEACTESDAFRHTKCQATADKNVKTVIRGLASGSCCTVPHMLLPYDIKVFSVAGFAADDWFYLMTLAKEQCKAIANSLESSLCSDLDTKRGTLLRSIRQGVQLKPVDTNNLTDHNKDILNDALARALEWDRKCAKTSSKFLSVDYEESSEDDEWDEDYEDVQRFDRSSPQHEHLADIKKSIPAKIVRKNESTQSFFKKLFSRKSHNKDTNKNEQRKKEITPPLPPLPPMEHFANTAQSKPPSRDASALPAAPPPSRDASALPPPPPPPAPPAPHRPAPYPPTADLFDMESDYECMVWSDITKQDNKKSANGNLGKGDSESPTDMGLPVGPEMNTELYDNVMDYMKQFGKEKPLLPTRLSRKKGTIDQPKDFSVDVHIGSSVPQGYIPPPPPLPAENQMKPNQAKSKKINTKPNISVDVDYITPQEVGQLASAPSTTMHTDTTRGMVEKLLNEYCILSTTLRDTVHQLKLLDPSWSDEEEEHLLDIPTAQVQGLSSMWSPHYDNTSQHVGNKFPGLVPVWDVPPESVRPDEASTEDLVGRFRLLHSTLWNCRKQKRKQIAHHMGAPANR